MNLDVWFEIDFTWLTIVLLAKLRIATETISRRSAEEVKDESDSPPGRFACTERAAAGKCDPAVLSAHRGCSAAPAIPRNARRTI